jgi:hypothetical protein
VDFVFMRSVRLFLWFFFGVALSFFSLFAFAGEPHLSNPSNDPMEACNSYALEANNSWSGACTYVSDCPSSQNGGQCMLEVRRDFASLTGSVNFKQFLSLQVYCPDITPNWNGTECVKTEDKCKPLKGINVTSAYVGPEATRLTLDLKANANQEYLGHMLCSDNCKAVITKEVGSSGMAFGGRYYGVFEAKFDGSSCPTEKPDLSPTSTPDKVVSKDSDEKKCVDQGQGFGYVNGVVMCVTPDSKKGTADKKTETQNQDGTKTTVETNVTMACTGDGSCVTTTTTTTTVTNPDGTQQSQNTDVKTETKSSNGSDNGGSDGSAFCVQNPTSPICKNGTFSGSCSSPPTCSGDAVQCATAKAVFETKCALVPNQQVLDSGAEALDGGNDATKDATKRTEVQVVLGDSGSSSGSCPGDRSFSVGGQTVVIPFSELCGGMDVMRIAIIAIASFTAAMIIIGGVK